MHPDLALVLQPFGHQEREFQRLIGVEAGITVRVVAVRQLRFRDRRRAPRALRHVLSGHLDVDAAGRHQHHRSEVGIDDAAEADLDTGRCHRSDHHPRTQPGRHLDIGGGDRGAVGEVAFAEQFAVKPEPEQYPGCLISAADLKAYCKEAGLKLTAKKSELAAQVRTHNPDAAIWDDILAAFERRHLT